MSLNETQQKVLYYVHQGLNNNEIANELNYSVANVKKVLSELMKYFGAKNRVQLVSKTVLFLLAKYYSKK